MKRYECSHNTLRRALAILAEEGFVQPIHGKGVLVLYRPRERALFEIGGIETFKEAARRNRLHTTTTVTHYEPLTCDAELSSVSGFAKGTDLFYVERVRSLDGKPVILDKNYFLATAVSGLTSEIASHSVYEYLERELGMGRPTTIECVLFDFDGVTADTEALSVQLLIKQFQAIGVNPSVEELEALAGTAGDDSLQQILDAHHSSRTVAELFADNAANGAVYRRMDIKPSPGVVDLVRAIRARGILVGLVSQTLTCQIIYALNRFGMTSLYDAIVCGDMGSLAQISDVIPGVINGDLYIVNNVSTGLALEVGEALVAHESVDDALRAGISACSPTYRVVRGTKGHVVIASHNRFARGLADTLDFLGNKTELDVICAYVDETPLVSQVDELFSAFSPDDEVLILTDILQGSVNQAFAPYINDHVFLVAGVNVALSLELCLSAEGLTVEGIEEAIEMGRQSMSFCSIDEYYNVTLQLTLGNYENLLNPSYVQIYVQSLVIAALSTIICLVLGYPFAYLISRTFKEHKIILYMIDDGKLDRSQVVDLGDVVRGVAPGRESDDDIFWFSIGGIPVEDVSWGTAVYRKAVELGIGTKLKLWDEPALA